MKFNAEELVQFVEKCSPPQASERHFGFLELIKKQSSETVNSALYTHFFNSSNLTHKALFRDSLLELINKQRPGQPIKFINPIATRTH